MSWKPRSWTGCGTGAAGLVREVLDDLRKDRPLAYTTVMTVMENLHRKGWLRRAGMAVPGVMNRLAPVRGTPRR